MSSIIKFIADINPLTKSPKLPTNLPVKLFPGIDTKFYHSSCYDFEKGYCSKYVLNTPQSELANLNLITILLIILALFFIRNMLLILNVEKEFFNEISKDDDYYETCRDIGKAILTRFRRKVLILHSSLFLYYTLEFLYNWTHLYYLKIVKELVIFTYTVVLMREIEYLKSILEEKNLENANANEFRNRKCFKLYSKQDYIVTPDENKISYFEKIKNYLILKFDSKKVATEAFILWFISIALIVLSIRSDIINVLIIFFLNLIIFRRVLTLSCTKMKRLCLQPFIFCTIATILFITDYFSCKLDWLETGALFKPYVKNILNLIFRLHLNYLITFFMSNIFLIEYYKYTVTRFMMFDISTYDFYLFTFINFEINPSNFTDSVKSLVTFKNAIKKVNECDQTKILDENVTQNGSFELKTMPNETITSSKIE